MTRAEALRRVKASSEALFVLSPEAWEEAREQIGLPPVFVWDLLTVPELLAFSAACRIRLADAGVSP